MDRHFCRQCGCAYNYCRACVFKPVPYKEAGFCSEQCYKASKIKEIPKEDSGVVLIDKDIDITPENE